MSAAIAVSPEVAAVTDTQSPCLTSPLPRRPATMRVSSMIEYDFW